MKLVIALTTLGLCAAAANATVVDWSAWTAATGSTANGVMPGAGVGIGYSGEISFTQINNSGTDYWRQGGVTPWPAYVSGSVSNAPITTDLVAISGNGTLNTVTFSQPVVNPYMAIVSLGQNGIGSTYEFDAAFQIISVGQGHWGNGTLANTGVNGLGGETLVGFEGHGVIQFIGVFNSISWTTVSNVGEYWNGFTFGVVPTPGAAAVLGLGGLAAARRRR